MITVIIAGGSGTRLWPLSTPDYPKHLLRLNGQQSSLLQNTYERVLADSSAVYVVSEIGHIHHVKEQLPDLPEEAFIVESARRGTASCILLALDYIARQKPDPTEPIAFVSADHYIRDTAGFTHSFQVASAASQKENRLVLVGVEPDYPATGLGYIQKDGLFDPQTFVFNVESFKEKPSYEVAQTYLKSGKYLWNCGYFVGSLHTFEKALQTANLKLRHDYESLRHTDNEQAREKLYLKFETNSIDYALIEKVDNLLVVPASFDWMDLGSFTDLHKASHRNEVGNHVHGDQVETDEVTNSFIQNHEAKPVAVVGLDNIVVVNTKDGLLVARKDMSQQIGEISKRFKSKK